MNDASRLALVDAAKLLGRREYTEVEMLGLLSSRHAESAFEPVIKLLSEIGMIAGSKGVAARRALGYVELKTRLRSKGVDASSIDLLLESDLATEVERTKILVQSNLPGEKDVEKVLRFLSFRGVDDNVSRALARHWN